MGMSHSAGKGAGVGYHQPVVVHLSSYDLVLLVVAQEVCHPKYDPDHPYPLMDVDQLVDHPPMMVIVLPDQQTQKNERYHLPVMVESSLVCWMLG